MNLKKKQKNIYHILIFGFYIITLNTGHAQGLNFKKDNDPNSAFFGSSQQNIQPLNLPPLPDSIHLENTKDQKTTEKHNDNNLRNPDKIFTGVLLNQDGYILTDSHDINGCKSLKISSPNGTTLDTTLIKTQKSYDLALLKTNAIPTTIPLRIRDNPLNQENMEATSFNQNTLNVLSAPIQISEKQDEIDMGKYLEGSTGGPIFDGNGDLAGIIFHNEKDGISASSGTQILEFLDQNSVILEKSNVFPSNAVILTRTRPDKLVLRIGCY